jgi:hypothetical protein
MDGESTGTEILSGGKKNHMKDWLRTLLAGYGAYKWGGGCLGTIVVFILLYWLLGQTGC